MRSRHVLALAGGLLLLAFAYSPLLQAGLLAPDFALLIDGGAVDGEATLSRLSLLLSRALWSLPAAGESAVALRLENLALHVAAAIGLGFFTRRLLLPWSGSEQAVAAARSAEW